MKQFKKFIVKGEDSKNLRELRKILNKTGRYCLMKMSGRDGDYGKQGIYMLHGIGKIINRGGAPCLETFWLSGWYVTSDIQYWEHAPDNVWERTWPPEHMLKEGEVAETERHVSKVILLKTLNSTYEIRYTDD